MWAEEGITDAEGFVEVCPQGIDDLRKIVENHSAVFFTWGEDKVFVDAITANMLCTVYDACGQKARDNIDNAITKSPGLFLKVVDIGWSCVKR